MNRQTLAVALGTLGLVVLGAILLYATPSPEATRIQRQPTPTAPTEDKTKAEKGPRHLRDARLVHASEVPADRKKPAAGSPNVVLVIESSQRRDQWSAYGGDPDVTPFMAAKAKEGVRMMDGLTVAVSPRPADAAVITGLYPHHAGVAEPEDKRNFRPMKDSVDTLAERFQQAGWVTVGATANHNLNAKAGAMQGFDWYRDAQPFALKLEQRVPASEVVSKVLARVEQRTDEEKAHPIYLQLAFVDSHKPFRVPPDEAKPFQKTETSPAPYLATVHAQDEAVKALVEGLAAQGITAENTVFVVVADHGEGLEMPKFHRMQHGFVLYESSVQVPWIWWGKDIPAGHDVTDLASTIDVAPTLLALAGLKGQPGFDGVDLSKAVLGKSQKTGRTVAYADTMYEGAHRASIWTSQHQCQNDYGSQIMEADQFVKACYDRTTDHTFETPIEDADLANQLEVMHKDLLEAASG
ncbi:MAG: sulfatase [Alphaproteobacteria bacterium]|nr:sulfatase [Alphaproteobacteria bacterium]